MSILVLLSLLTAGNTMDSYRGCYTDDSARALPLQLMSSGATVESCVAAAEAYGLKYAGLQWYGYCFGGSSLGYVKAPERDCNTLCSSNPAEMCGGALRNSIYATKYAPQATLNLYQGCYTDSANRALPVLLMSSGATVEGCVAAAAAQGLAYAGLQATQWCFGGNVLGYAKALESNCNMPCNSNQGEICGGAWRNSVYAARALPYDSPFQGCYVDAASRLLPVLLMTSGATVESCVAAARAQKLLYAGLEAGGWCFGGNSLGGSLATASDCQNPCATKPSEMCGGQWRISIYATNNTPPIPVPTVANEQMTDAQSARIVTDAAPLEEFSPYVTSVVFGPAQDWMPAQVLLVTYGVPDQPDFPWGVYGGTAYGATRAVKWQIWFDSGGQLPKVTNLPMLQRTVYWHVLDQNWTGCPVASEFDVTESVQTGMSDTDGVSLATELNVIVKLPNQTKLLPSDWFTLSSKVTETVTHSETISSQTTNTRTFKMPCVPGQYTGWTIWQLNEEFDILGPDGQPWVDPNYRAELWPVTNASVMTAQAVTTCTVSGCTTITY